MLARIYNDRFNTNIPAKYDGSHLDLPGASLDITLRPHQKDAIWRGIQDGTALFDHVVGAGKTLVCVGTIMESKRMGLMSKPMLVVPNHLLLQWKDAFYSLYPNANILVAEKSDFKKETRAAVRPHRNRRLGCRDRRAQFVQEDRHARRHASANCWRNRSKISRTRSRRSSGAGRPDHDQGNGEGEGAHDGAPRAQGRYRRERLGGQLRRPWRRRAFCRRGS
ncbi:DEAD/DEAH box helicase family protein [Burkholderia sp. CCA53]|uniref:DEAD/DEAH box helicase family protein n=1 Tax=Burkholderia sp. CCA53 TaxID=1776288 RepID=UPI0020C78AF2|nr:DEAD/DEAH box helicase family protein [Burkholderia sp. CCA53]